MTHTTRRLKAYNFTEADLESIAMANVVSGVAFSVSAGVFTFCIDISKDVLMAADAISPLGLALHLTVNWIGFPVALVLAGVGIWAQVKRGNVISRVKRESENVA